MHAAAEKGQVECVNVLARHGAGVNKANRVSVEAYRREWRTHRRLFVFGVCGGEQHGATPTHCAAEHGRVECIDALVRHGADVSKADTVRYCAQQLRDLRAVLCMVTVGCIPGRTDPHVCCSSRGALEVHRCARTTRC